MVHFPLKSQAHSVIALLPAPLRVQIYYLSRFGRLPNLSRPQRFSEHIQKVKLARRDQRITRMVDKVGVKAIVASIVGSDWVTPTLYAGADTPPDETLASIPLPFVVKAAHGSGWNLFVRTVADRGHVSEVCNSWLTSTYHGERAGEWVYRGVPKGVLIEPFIGEADRLPVDYKFFVFGGRVLYVQVDTDREADHKRTFFDRDWVRQDFELEFAKGAEPIAKPSCLAEMIDGAEHLADGFPFVRVDLYDIGGRPRFGEMTFMPGSGYERFRPEIADLQLGQLWPTR